jgi:hypothetical protein
MCCGCGCGSGKWMFKHEPSVAKRLARGIRGLKSKLLFYFTIVCRRIFCIYSLCSLFISFFLSFFLSPFSPHGNESL